MALDRDAPILLAFAVPYVIPSGVLAAPGRPGANDRIGIAGIGVGRQGGGLIGQAGRIKEVRMVAMADVNLPRAEQMASAYGAKAYQGHHAAFRNFKPAGMPQGIFLPIHPGALKYYKEKGYVK